MRERWARRLALLTCVLVLTLTAAFAISRNLGTAPPVPAMASVAAGAGAEVDAAAIESGRAVYDELDCAGCHSIAGEGSPRSPLDGVGAQLDRAQLREWVIGGDSVAEDLSPRALRVKHGYRELEPARMDALVEYLASLTD